METNKTKFNLYKLLFDGLLIYYWAMLYVIKSGEIIEQYSPKYFLFILPISFFLIFTFPKLFKNKFELGHILLIVFLFLVLMVSLLRMDISSIFTYTLQVLTILVLLRLRLSINLKLVNILFILSIAGSIFSFYLGQSFYGFLPGQSYATGVLVDEGEAWRVSLFPSVPDSGFFSLLIIILNYKFNHNKIFKIVMILIASYFFFLSGMRSSFICLLFYITFEIVKKLKEFRVSNFYRWYNFLAVIFMILVLNMNALLISIGDTGNVMLNNILFKNEVGIEDPEVLQKTIFRTLIWAEHIDIFLAHPLIGIGTFDFQKVAKNVIISNTPTSGSESPLTSVLARFGGIGLLYTFSLISLYLLALKKRDDFSYFVIFLIMIIMLTYGSFMVPYSFMFLLLWGSYNNIVVNNDLIKSYK